MCFPIMEIAMTPNLPHDQTPDTGGERPYALTLDETPLDLGVLDGLYNRRIRLTLAEGACRRIERSRERLEALAAGDEPVYGVNTGFGHLCTRRIDTDQLARLQENLLLSHAVGVGPAVPDEIVRLMMLLKIVALAQGYSGVRLETVKLLAGLLDADLLPVVPTRGSLGASGDLAPLAHMVLPLIGRGTVRRPGGPILPAGDAMADAGLQPTTLAAKEGLALINGTQFVASYAAGLVVRAVRLLKHADVVAAVSLEALRGSIKPFDQRLNALRPHRGAMHCAANIRLMMTASKILESHADCGRVQDPYSLRCVPQVHGATRQAVSHAADVVSVEINSVTDNPVILDDGSAISGGLFHAQPLAVMLDYLAIALAEMADISERRIYLLLSGHDGLPTLLMRETGINSGFMLPQYTAAALVSENKVLCHPASVDSIPTSLGQEDHVSMGATAATKAWQVMSNVETVLAIEMMCAAQALDYRAPIEPGTGVRIAHGIIRDHIDHAEQDRLFAEDIERSLQLLRSQAVVCAIESQMDRLQ